MGKQGLIMIKEFQRQHHLPAKQCKQMWEAQFGLLNLALA